MSLVSLQVNHLRNIHELNVNFSSSMNLFHGANGSGKTSILEAIHLLAMGRSFRTTMVNHAISNGADAILITGEAHPSFSPYPIPLKMLKHRAKRAEYSVLQQPAASAAELAQHLPVQLFNLDGYQLLGAAPELRRRFVDWMMFHVEHSFFKLWQDFHQVLRQRNALLKGYGDRSQLPYWTEKLGELGQALHHLRSKTLQAWWEYAFPSLNESPGVKGLQMHYEPGWSFEGSYTEFLYVTVSQDAELGYTSGGPHRSDLLITCQDNLARHMLSTGQQKTFVSALQLAQCQWVAERTEKVPILLVDDLPSELDKQARKWLIKQLISTKSQVFLTSVEGVGFDEISQESAHKMFHVEHGKLREMSQQVV